MRYGMFYYCNTLYHALQMEVRTGEAASGSILDTSSSVAAVAKGSEALDSLGIPGWDKVDQLARALVDLRGHCKIIIAVQSIWLVPLRSKKHVIT